jgi:hypothetical protein
MYKVDWQHDGKPGHKEFGTLYLLGEWIHNLHWWGVKPTQINIRYEE